MDMYVYIYIFATPDVVYARVEENRPTVHLMHSFDFPNKHSILNDIEIKFIQMRYCGELRTGKARQRMEIEPVNYSDEDIDEEKDWKSEPLSMWIIG